MKSKSSGGSKNTLEVEMTVRERIEQSDSRIQWLKSCEGTAQTCKQRDYWYRERMAEEDWRATLMKLELGEIKL